MAEALCRSTGRAARALWNHADMLHSLPLTQHGGALGLSMSRADVLLAWFLKL
jgi:hypothetical protein